MHLSSSARLLEVLSRVTGGAVQGYGRCRPGLQELLEALFRVT